MLQIENLEVCYGAISALGGVSFKVEAGTIVTLVGSNGARPLDRDRVHEVDLLTHRWSR